MSMILKDVIMKSLCRVTVSAHDSTSEEIPDLGSLTFGEKVLLFDNYTTTDVEVYCSACKSFSVEFRSGCYVCEKGLDGWNTGRCSEFNRR
jgi:spore coat protein U-like protein